jgi:hypothetical protein
MELDGLRLTWGQGNKDPLININNINISEFDIEVKGKNQDTVQITKNGIVYMFFKQSEEQVQEFYRYSEMQIDIVGTTNVNAYFNKITPQIFVKDYVIRDSRLSF